MQHFLSAKDIAALPERRHQHQFNANAVRQVRSIGDLLGLQRLGVHLVRLEPGNDSTTYHYHEADEEFLFILEGRGIAHIGDEEHEVTAGDFMAFTAPSAAHSLRNPQDNNQDLIYLMGGERNLPDIVHYPEIDRVMYKSVTGERTSAPRSAFNPVR